MISFLSFGVFLAGQFLVSVSSLFRYNYLCFHFLVHSLDFFIHSYGDDRLVVENNLSCLSGCWASTRLWAIWQCSHGPVKKNIGYQQAGSRGCLFCLCYTWRGSSYEWSSILSWNAALLFNLWDKRVFRSKLVLINLQEAAEELAPRLEIILQHLMCAFGKYQVFSLPCPFSWILYRYWPDAVQHWLLTHHTCFHCFALFPLFSFRLLVRFLLHMQEMDVTFFYAYYITLALFS